ncbi:helix-turn-helix domain-containing protein [Actinomadura gamaensis]|uniref:Helix-turn-helix domain-containing protein n=1 Tax=Actinomadura gamaensis TaxID=1763541 RepID=A0ABV9TUU8_9ACTN
MLIDAVEELSATAAAGLTHLPDTATSLIFRLTTTGRADLLVAGPRTRAAYFSGKDLPVCVRARLRPGVARAALGMPITELVDRVVPLTDVWHPADASHLEHRLSTLDGDPALIAEQLDAALRAKLVAQSTHSPDSSPNVRFSNDARLVHAAAHDLASARPTRLPDLAHRLAISERRLRSLFTENAGLPPKVFTRINRLRAALTKGSSERLAQLAATTGYYDQSHMTADFRAMLGVSPAAFFAGRLPTPSTC